MIVSPEGELVATRRGVTSSSWAEPRVKSLFILGSKIGIETVSILGRDCRAPRALPFDNFGEGGNAAEPDIVIRPIPGALAMAVRRASGSMPFTAAKLGALRGSAIAVVGERWGAESALTMGPGKRCLSAGVGREGAGLNPMMKRSGVGPPWRAHAHHS